MEKLKPRKPIRFKNHVYSLNGYYFITICSFNSQNIFGKIINNNKIVGADGCRPDNNNIKIELNEFGVIVDSELTEFTSDNDATQKKVLNFYIEIQKISAVYWGLSLN